MQKLQGELNISVRETSELSDFLRYLFILIREGLLTWIWYVSIIKIFGEKRSKFVVIKNNKEIIGGFFVSSFSLMRYKPYNLFNKEVWAKISELETKGYKYFACFVVKRKYRNKGAGTIAFNSYFRQNPMKIYFTSSKKAVRFYLRNGAKIFFPSKYTIYTFDAS